MTAHAVQGALPTLAAEAARTASRLAPHGHLVMSHAPREPDTKEAYGCVDWFCYPVRQVPESPAQTQ